MQVQALLVVSGVAVVPGYLSGSASVEQCLPWLVRLHVMLGHQPVGLHPRVVAGMDVGLQFEGPQCVFGGSAGVAGGSA